MHDTIPECSICTEDPATTPGFCTACASAPSKLACAKCSIVTPNDNGVAQYSSCSGDCANYIWFYI